MERLEMKAGTLTLEILPALGGKISSLRRDGVELLQAPLRPYALRTPGMQFEESDASGIDECLPSVAACAIAGETGAVQIPDHGEFWRLPCEVERRGTCEVKLSATGSVLPLRLERTLKLEGETLRIDYRLENVGEGEAPYVWSAHPLFCVDAGDAILLPASVRQVTVEGSAHARLGAKGSVCNWPAAELSGGGKVDLSRAGDRSDDTGDKLYAAAPVEGWAAIERRQAGLRVQVGFDPARSPYLGLWLCYGGWPERQEGREQCVALEPCTAPGDSLAEALEKGRAKVLAPGQSAFWWMTIAVSEIS
ncbi:MAG: hypothetical protein WA634_08280 [Silvibacterium sp.]